MTLYGDLVGLQDEPSGRLSGPLFQLSLPADVRRFTTGLWSHRLCRTPAAGRAAGTLGSTFLKVPVDVATAALAAVVRLPAASDLGLPVARLGL